MFLELFLLMDELGLLLILDYCVLDCSSVHAVSSLKMIHQHLIQKDMKDA